MSLRAKLISIVFFIALIPLSLVGWSTLRIHRQAFDKKINELHHQTAVAGAQLIQLRLQNIEQTLLQTVRSWTWASLSPSERNGALWLIYRQLDQIVAVSLLDEKGEGIGPSAYLDQPTNDDTLNKHPRASIPALAEFAKQIPFKTAQKNGVARSAVFVAPGIGSPLLSWVIRVPGGQTQSWSIAVALSLEAVCQSIQQMGSEQTHVLLLDPSNRAVCSSLEKTPLSPAASALLPHPAPGKVENRQYQTADRETMLATITKVDGSWALAVRQSVASAFSSSRTMQAQMIFWIAVSALIAAVTGIFLSRSISQPIRRLVGGTEALTQGNYDIQLTASGKDELAKLSRTFNRMCEEIKKRDDEIRAWNRELQQRVEDKTRELKEVQEQLLHSQKIAAVTSLGAGVAHEINNPLTGVLGVAQLLTMSVKTDPSLEPHQELFEIIEKEAQRIRDIVGTLQSFSNSFKGDRFCPVEIKKLLALSTSTIQDGLENRKIELTQTISTNVPPVMGDPNRLNQVFVELLKNACIAMPDGGKIDIDVSSVEGRAVKINVNDTGIGIQPDHLDRIFEPFFTTKDNWQGEGLGLTLVYRIVEEHHGTIKVESRVGKGTLMSVVLPAAKGGAHLD